MRSSLRDKTIKGVGWSFIDNIASQGIAFLVGLVLARILTPSEFGVLGMVTIFIALSNSIVDSGFSNALIRKRDADSIDYSTVFIFNLITAVILYFILYLFSPSISHFFKEPQLIAITRVLGLLLIINALGIIQRTLLNIEVDFKAQTKISVIASLISAVVGISMAYQGYGVWSLVGQQLSRQTVNSILLWVYSSWRPRLVFSWKSFKELFGFGSKLLLSGLLDTGFKNIYYIIIGRFYTADQLGQYTRAEQFNIIFSSNLTSIVQRVSYPVLSSIQDEQDRLREAYRRVIKVTMMVTFACMLGLAAIAKPLILILIGDQWIQAVKYLQIICFSGMLYPLHAINLNMLQVKGRSDLFLKLEVVKKCLAVFPVFFGVFLGIEVMLWGSFITSIIAFFINSMYSGRLIKYSSTQQVKDILPTFIISLLIALVMYSITFLKLNDFITIGLQCFIGLSCAWGVYEKFEVSEYKELKGVISSFVNQKK